MKLVIVLITGFFLLASFIGSSHAQLLYHDSVSGNQIVLEKTVNINIILIGDTWSNQEISQIKSSLKTSYEPYVDSAKEKLGIKYKYQYNFYSASDTDSNDVFSFMAKNAQAINVIGNLGKYQFFHAWWILENHPEWVTLGLDKNGNVQANYKINYKVNNAEELEKYLYDNIISKNNNLSDKNSVNMIFLKGGLDKVNYLHHYYVPKFDDAQNTQANAIGLMGYGGNYNLYFFDLYAVPWADFDFNSSTWYVPKEMGNLHDCKETKCFTDLVSKRVEGAAHHIITPSFVYPVKFQPKYVVDILVYVKPGFSTTLTPQTVTKFINTEKIRAELSELYPASQWDVRISVEKRSDRGLSYEFKKALESVQHKTMYDPYGNEVAVELYNSNSLQPYLSAYATEKIKQSSTDSDATVIPVLLVVDNTDHALFLDSVGTMGFAAPLTSDKESPCCALGITNEKSVWNNQLGSTNLMLHEIGHVMGLAHPFQGLNDDNTVNYDPYWNWYLSPMTYGFAPSGCGFVFSLVYTSPCGFGSTSFTEFEKQRIADSLFVSMVKGVNEKASSSNQDLANTMSKLGQAKEMFAQGDSIAAVNILKSSVDSKNTVPDSDLVKSSKTNVALPSKFGSLSLSSDEVIKDSHSIASLTISGKVNNVMKGQSVIIEITRPDGTILQLRTLAGSDGKYVTTLNIDPNSPIGQHIVNAAYMGEKSNSASFIVKDQASEQPKPKNTQPTIQEDIQDKPASNPEIPNWIKNNAKWWSEGVIEDTDFIQGVQYLVKEGIIKVSSAKGSGSSSGAIPSWIKNNAKWWADGQISDGDFVKGIQFMIENGIIKP